MNQSSEQSLHYIRNSATKGAFYLTCCTYAYQNEVKDNEMNQHKQNQLKILITEKLFQFVHPTGEKLYAPVISNTVTQQTIQPLKNQLRIKN